MGATRGSVHPGRSKLLSNLEIDKTEDKKYQFCGTLQITQMTATVLHDVEHLP